MISRTCIRRFTTSQPRLGLMDFFKKTKIKEPTAPKVPVKKTKEVMKELTKPAEADQIKPVKLRVIGSPPDPLEEWEKVRNGFEVNPWPLAYNRSTITTDEIEKALKSAYEKVFNNNDISIDEIKSTALDNLQQRFDFFKAVSKEMKLAIPDVVLSESRSISALQRYLNSNVAGIRFDEKNPEAIHLEDMDFEGLNITYIDKKAEKKQAIRRYAEALEQAKEAERVEREAVLKKSVE